MTYPRFPIGVVAEPAEQAVDEIGRFYQWAVARPHEDQAAAGVFAAVRWLNGRRGTGPVSDRPTPTTLDEVRSEYATARGSLLLHRGSVQQRDAGVCLVLALAVGDLGAVPGLLRVIGPAAPLYETSITTRRDDCAA